MRIAEKIRELYRLDEDTTFYFKALSLLFIITFLVGVMTATLFPLEARQGVDEVSRQLEFLSGAGPFQIFGIIFLNNAIKSFVALSSGILFGIIPVVFILVNGYAIGIISAVAIAEQGTVSVLALTLPHGIFEIPAVLLAASYGVMLGEKFYGRIKRGEPFRLSFSLATNAFFKIIVPILAIAAFIETTIGVVART
ncbi:MAG: stage II sporulation protein M [Candidatus Yonathbacteria bacterium]|nr:stage II sporulation protein M [Candidatus Yonathbacteria bacterium]